MYEGECCSGCGIHPSVWNPKLGGDFNALVPEWEYCRVCDLVEQAEAAGPPPQAEPGAGHPEHGWHMVLKPPKKPHNR